jgi:septal ring factor EnvC (AmiA/AmiB activator)
MSSNGSIIIRDFKFIPKPNNKWDVKILTPGTTTYVAKVVSNGNKNKLIQLIEEQGHSIEGINIKLLNKKNSSLTPKSSSNNLAYKAEAQRRLNQAQAAAQANVAAANAAKRAAAAQANVAAANAAKRAAAAQATANAQTAQASALASSTKNVAQNLGPTRLTRTSSFSGLSSFFSPKPKSANSASSSTVKQPVSRGFFTSTASVAKSAAKVSTANIQDKLAQSHIKKIEYENKIRNKETKQQELIAKISSLENALEGLRKQLINYNTANNKAQLKQLTEFITSAETKLASFFT